MPTKILFVDDDVEMCAFVTSALAARDFQVHTRHSADAAVLAIQGTDFEVIVTDLKMDGMNGIELCRRLHESRPDVPVVVVTAFGSLDSAISAIRAGAYDFITKPVTTDDLAFTLRRAAQFHGLRREVNRLRDSVEGLPTFSEIIGESQAITGVFNLISKVADSEATVLISGESGTGKELVARALRKLSGRASGPYVAINCAAMPEQLLESELFGHVRGAFTDAKATKPGLLFRANGGTLFLDEIGETTPSMQMKLLRALQERVARPVGGDEERPFDVRIIAATNRDIETDVAENRFREDLYYRINVVRIEVPPLRARGTDVLLLAQYFIGQFKAPTGRRVTGLSGAAADKLLSYDWPGNVRELQNCIERAIAVTHFEEIGVDDLPRKIRDFQSSSLVLALDNPADLPSMEEVERRYVRKVLQAVGGNKTLAAKVLGFDRRTLYRKLGRSGDDEPESGGSLDRPPVSRSQRA